MICQLILLPYDQPNLPHPLWLQQFPSHLGSATNSESNRPEPSEPDTDSVASPSPSGLVYDANF